MTESEFRNMAGKKAEKAPGGPSMKSSSVVRRRKPSASSSESDSESDTDSAVLKEFFSAQKHSKSLVCEVGSRVVVKGKGERGEVEGIVLSVDRAQEPWMVVVRTDGGERLVVDLPEIFTGEEKETDLLGDVTQNAGAGNRTGNLLESEDESEVAELGEGGKKGEGEEVDDILEEHGWEVGSMLYFEGQKGREKGKVLTIERSSWPYSLLLETKKGRKVEVEGEKVEGWEKVRKAVLLKVAFSSQEARRNVEEEKEDGVDLLGGKQEDEGSKENDILDFFDDLDAKKGEMESCFPQQGS